MERSIMKFPKRVGVYALAGAITVASLVLQVAAAGAAAPPPAIAPRDGQHDFDWEGLTLFLYNPQTHQWSQTFANSKMGVLTPPLIGAFKDGRGELFSQDTVDGRSILVRAIWSNITANSHHFEESYSDDGGKTWAPAFIATLSREKQ
jgi:hypothetical protein